MKYRRKTQKVSLTFEWKHPRMTPEWDTVKPPQQWSPSSEFIYDLRFQVFEAVPMSCILCLILTDSPMHVFWLRSCLLIRSIRESLYFEVWSDYRNPVSELGNTEWDCMLLLSFSLSFLQFLLSLVPRYWWVELIVSSSLLVSSIVRPSSRFRLKGY